MRRKDDGRRMMNAAATRQLVWLKAPWVLADMSLGYAEQGTRPTNIQGPGRWWFNA